MIPQVLPPHKHQNLLSFAFVQDYLRNHDMDLFLQSLERYAEHLAAEDIMAQDIKVLTEALLQERESQSHLRRLFTNDLLYFHGGILSRLIHDAVIPSGPQWQVRIDSHAPALHNFLDKVRGWELHHPHMRGWSAIAYWAYRTLEQHKGRVAKLYAHAIDGSVSLDEFVMEKCGSSIEKALLAQWCFERSHIPSHFVLGELQRGGTFQVVGFSLLTLNGSHYILDHEHPYQLHPHWLPFTMPIAGLSEDFSITSGRRTYRLCRSIFRDAQPHVHEEPIAGRGTAIP